MELASSDRSSAALIGVLLGEGIGPKIMNCVRHVLHGVENRLGATFEVKTGGDIGRLTKTRHGVPLPEEAFEFCSDIFSRGGAILSGPGGGRFVCDLRSRFDLFFKISPSDRANPAGQIFLLAMLLRESFGLGTHATWIEAAARAAWASGWRTSDIAESGCTIVGTRGTAPAPDRILKQPAGRPAAAGCPA